MVFRVYVERKPAFAVQAQALFKDIRSFLGIRGLQGVRVVNRYDVEHIDRGLFDQCRKTVFSEPQTDEVFSELPVQSDERARFAVEYLPGQFDQRADSAAQCIELIGMGKRPAVRTATVYLLYGALSEEDIAAIKKHLVNPVESREASMEEYDSLDLACSLPEAVPIVEGFRELDDTGVKALIGEYGLAMDEQDVFFCIDYFKRERRDPTLTELRVIDTYWSDHCRHTTFLTALDSVKIDHPAAKKAYERYLEIREELGIKKPVTLMDVGTIAAKALKKRGLLTGVDESEEINACTVNVKADVDGREEDYLLLFKNETHNHPTEIEPFGGAATCIGGAIRDPLSGRAYVYQAMRVTGAADPLAPVEKTLPGKLPQRRIVTAAAAGYSSYGNQIGLATGLVDEIYHPGYAAKHMEVGAVVGAAPKKNVRREEPAPGDAIVLLGGRTGRDGCGGATGSSKSHCADSLESCGAEVQKGNAPEERKLQRLFRNPEAARLIKRCNDFGAGGVAVAVGELAGSLTIDLDAIPKKYEGLSGTELAISESQERMAVVLDEKDVEKFIALAREENLEATSIARVVEEQRLKMRFAGQEIVDLSREFLNTNGAQKHASAHIVAPRAAKRQADAGGVGARLLALAQDLNACSKRALSERFDSTIGGGSVLMPFGGARRRTPAQAMVAKLPVLGADTTTCSAMAYGYDPYLSEADAYSGAYLAVAESLAKLAATGVDYKKCYLSFQEYFARVGNVPERWGVPLCALLGALCAQMDLGVAAIGGKDSMSGSFENLDVPPTLLSFAVGVLSEKDVISPEFKRTGSRVVLLCPEKTADGLPDAQSMRALLERVHALVRNGRILAAQAVGARGVAHALLRMGLGNRIGVDFEADIDAQGLFSPGIGSFVLELAAGEPIGRTLGYTSARYAWTGLGEVIELDEIEDAYERALEAVYPSCAEEQKTLLLPDMPIAKAQRTCRRGSPIARPRVLIPVFPGTNCEYDTARAFERDGAIARILVLRNLSAKDISDSVDAFLTALDQSQILFLPGGFSAGDEPDGSGKFITAFLRNPRIGDGLSQLLDERDGLIGGICNGFQALVKLGLLPFGRIREMDENCPTLTYNTIGRHQSRLVYTRVISNGSPWLMHARVGDIHLAPVSHGEGRFVCPDALLKGLARSGRIATQYCDAKGTVDMSVDVNPNGSVAAVEGITSPDGRIFGKMAHSERTGKGLYKNVPGDQSMPMFEGAVDYFKL
ncbi:MAG: phosphoribosylformylglycinamidine synthase [Bacillota bacterium]